MQENKTIQAISKLSSSELNWFRDFVHSPYFNTHENLYKLIDLIVEAAPGVDEKQLEKKKVFEKIFPKEKFNSQKLSDLLTYLYRLYEKFLIQLEYEQDIAQNKLL